ncbi:DUF4190 domain-containing protein [Ruania alba]|uniref:DUF4190 domain-containing protein n=1 Tax=Ruania alba TaxID=648782 RepID=A0A1H5KJ33_9MICO|nr:DUF4190 domain-containing protein [Ruania alba]SEE63988.1 protein of unknown function [Ruania alba]
MNHSGEPEQPAPEHAPGPEQGVWADPHSWGATGAEWTRPEPSPAHPQAPAAGVENPPAGGTPYAPPSGQAAPDAPPPGQTPPYAPPSGQAAPYTGPGPAADPTLPPIPQAPQSTPQGPVGQSMYGSRPAPEPHAAQGSYGEFTFPVLQRAKVEPTAVASVATALLGPVAVALGLVARGRVRRHRRRSMGLAWTGIGLGAFFTIAWVLLTVVLAGNGTIDRMVERPEAGDVTEARTVGASNVAVGNCIEFLPPGQIVGEVRLVPCEQQHIAQAISSHPLTGDFPGTDAVAEQALEACAPAVSELASSTPLTPWYLAPSEEAWNQGVTEVLCVARGGSGPFEGDLLAG